MIDAGVEDVQPFEVGSFASGGKKRFAEFGEDVAAELSHLGARGQFIGKARFRVVGQHQIFEGDAARCGVGEKSVAIERAKAV